MASSGASSTSNAAAVASTLQQLTNSCHSSTTGNSFDFGNLASASSPEVPQWKLELIQRRRQQQLHQAGKLVTETRSTSNFTTSTTTTTATAIDSNDAATAAAAVVVAAVHQCGTHGGVGLASSSDVVNSCTCVRNTVAVASSGDDATTLLDARYRSCSTPVTVTVVSTTTTTTTTPTSPTMRFEATDAAPLAAIVVEADEFNGRPKCRPGKEMLDIVELAKIAKQQHHRHHHHQDDGESDSSEELQYGPGIVDKLRSKYLNMTLKEMNKNRASVQAFRRAASLEDLLDHKDESAEKTRRYAKKNVTGTAAKVERYRNAARGNETMKRARSVETLMRCNSSTEENHQNQQTNKLVLSNVFKQENDHIILVDRTTVKIENRLLDKDRLKPVNKPKRIKPVLAETERPPPDLVKTTMRIFESSSVKKLKPKGEVAVKIATFKTINDTFKAQNQKKIIPKPPLQPKPFVNGNAKLTTSPRKIILTRKPTAELIEQNSQESYHNDGVVTEPIISSVSLVVSKFQQIERSYSPSSSPEPSKVRFSPIPSPEPSAVRAKVSSLDLKSSPTGNMPPIPSPRTTPPKLQSPLSPRTEANAKQPSIFVQKSNSTPLTSKYEQSKLSSPLSSEVPKIDFEQNKDEPSEEQVKETVLELNNQNSVETVNTSDVAKLSDSASSLDSTLLVESFDEVVEVVDSPRTVSKSALDNISKAGMTVQFSFNDSPSIKSYLPRPVASTPNESVEASFECELASPKLVECCARLKSPSAESPSTSSLSELNSTTSLESPVRAEADDKAIFKEDPPKDGAETKPIGAISSLSLIKSTTTTTFSQGNESKTIRSQKPESNSPPQKQIGIIRPLVSTKTQLPQQNLSNREIEKNLINRVKSIEQQQQQPTKVVVSLKSAEEIQPSGKKNNNSNNNSSAGLWDSKPWNQANNTMVFNFSNRKDVPDYIENDGLIIKRKREKPRQQQQQQQQQLYQSVDSSVIVSNIDCIQLTDDSDTEYSAGPPSPCDVAFCNDNILINGRSNLSRSPRNHKHRIQFDDMATRTFEYPSETSMLEAEGVTGGSNSSSGGSNADAETSASEDVAAAASGAARPSGTLPSLLA
ncbi:uncharacterized protein LOC106643669 isoform X2 [Copidosoma floridanum]|uniref:uncharacterized protein LOC106643669 isoform X2 n=1 Tax=Copidosoma floridanum TaxID=29053 RepID=UPI0006C9CAA9|nr:uncharacterized protein LOC106643669 isoform X2 [Copidosoma floridanum]